MNLTQQWKKPGRLESVVWFHLKLCSTPPTTYGEAAQLSPGCQWTAGVGCGGHAGMSWAIEILYIAVYIHTAQYNRLKSMYFIACNFCLSEADLISMFRNTIMGPFCADRNDEERESLWRIGEGLPFGGTILFLQMGRSVWSLLHRIWRLICEPVNSCHKCRAWLRPSCHKGVLVLGAGTFPQGYFAIDVHAGHVRSRW